MTDLTVLRHFADRPRRGDELPGTTRGDWSSVGVDDPNPNWLREQGRPLFALGEAESRNSQVIERRIKSASIEPMKSGFALGAQVLAIERKVTHKATGKEVTAMRWFITSHHRTALLAPVRKAGHHSLTQATEDFAANKWGAIRIINHQHLI